MAAMPVETDALLLEHALLGEEACSLLDAARSIELREMREKDDKVVAEAIALSAKSASLRKAAEAMWADLDGFDVTAWQAMIIEANAALDAAVALAPTKSDRAAADKYGDWWLHRSADVCR